MDGCGHANPKLRVRTHRFFIASGSVRVLNENNELLSTLSSITFFGEIALFCPQQACNATQVCMQKS